MSPTITPPRAIAALLLAASLAACGDTSDTSAPSGPDTSQATSQSDATSDTSRLTREDILTEYETALEKARETDGTGSPALWTMSDEDTTIHLFGTVHLLRPEAEWRTAEFDEKFNAADTLVLELDMESEEGQQAVARDFMSKGFYGDGRTLSSELSEDDLETLKAALEPMALPVTALDPMEPWMAAVNLSVLQLQNDGFDPNSGVEQMLIADAREDGMSFQFLETASDQANIFDNLPEPTQHAYLYETALTLEDSSQMLDQVIEEWADGDVEGLGVLVANPDTGGGDGIYDALFLERNRNWVPQIEALLEEPGVFFVAVGAGHLAGPDSVVTMLRDEGYEIEGP